MTSDNLSAFDLSEFEQMLFKIGSQDKKNEIRKAKK